MSDDGEPSGTAGKPILNVLQHKDIGDVMIVVARYFGGIKLGAGGLVRAYTNAAQDVIEALPVKLLVETRRYPLTVDYAGEQHLRHWLSQHQGSIIAHDYREAMHCVIELPIDQHDSLLAAVGANHWNLDPVSDSD